MGGSDEVDAAICEKLAYVRAPARERKKKRRMKKAA